MAEKDKSFNNVVYIGIKPISSYILACMTLFQKGSKDIYLKARGKTVSKAIYIAEILRRNVILDLKVINVKIGTEQIRNEGSSIARIISTIELILTK